MILAAAGLILERLICGTFRIRYQKVDTSMQIFGSKWMEERFMGTTLAWHHIFTP
jgi:hypothetical protein